MKNGISLKTFILLFTIATLVLIVIGFSYDTKGYISNILAEITGLFLSIIVAVLLVERFTEKQRKKRWERVRVLSHRAIAHHLNNIILELFNHFSIQGHDAIIVPPDNRNQSDAYSKLQMDKLIEQINQLIAQHQIQTESIREYFNSIKWDIAQIRHDLMPRIIQSSDNQELINVLIEFDDIVQDLQNIVIVKKPIVQPSVDADFRQLLEKIRAIYQLL